MLFEDRSSSLLTPDGRKSQRRGDLHTLERFSREAPGQHAAGGIDAGTGRPNHRQPEHRDAPRPDHDGLLRLAVNGILAQVGRATRRTPGTYSAPLIRPSAEKNK